jgi:undecaprenyl diphosphate synthase
MSQVPQHIAIIMDGNRRWAEKRHLPAALGHAAGVEALEKVVTAAVKTGVRYLTVYALSTENLQKRTAGELEELFKLIASGFVQKLPTLQEQNIKVVFLGEREGLPEKVQEIMSQTETKLSQNSGLNLAIAINYGAREEILQASKKSKSFTEEEFSKNLFTQNTPDPDLIIRTGGQKRLSNFLLWQAAYSELYFSDTLWPDFGEQEFLQSIEDYKARKRNFGS